MAISKKKLVKMGWKVTKTKMGNKIIIALFSAGTKGKTQEELRDIAEKSLNQKYKNKLKIRAKKENWDKNKLNVEIKKGRRNIEYKDEKLHYQNLYNLISNFLGAFTELGYVIPIGKKKIDKFHNVPVYALQLKFFFDWANTKLQKNIKFVYDWNFNNPTKKDWGDGFFIDWDLTPLSIRKTILKYPVENLIDKIKLYLFDRYILQNSFLRHEEKINEETREKIRIINGFPSEISEEVRRLERPEETKTKELRDKQTFGGYISPKLIEQSNEEENRHQFEEEMNKKEPKKRISYKNYQVEKNKKFEKDLELSEEYIRKKIKQEEKANRLKFSKANLNSSKELKAEYLKKIMDEWMITNDREWLLGKKKIEDMIKELKLTSKEILFIKKNLLWFFPKDNTNPNLV